MTKTRRRLRFEVRQPSPRGPRITHLTNDEGEARAVAAITPVAEVFDRQAGEVIATEHVKRYARRIDPSVGAPSP